MSETPDENFRHIIGSAFGQAEAHMGPDAYHSMVAVNQSIAEANKKSTELAVLQQENATAMSKSMTLVNLQRVQVLGAIAGLLWALAIITLAIGLSVAVKMWL